MNHTKQRQLIYETVQNSYAHPTADEVFRLVREQMPSISLGTIYRNLGVLTEMELIRKISVPGQADRFDRKGEWHDHMVCEVCGQMFDFTLTSEPALVAQIAKQSGMQVTGYSLVANCVCPGCTAKKTNPVFVG